MTNLESMGKILFLIPVRGGSKGLPGKNMRSVGGRSLIARAVETARAASSRLPEQQCTVFVSTEDPELAQEAIRAGASVPFMRPRELATDEATTIEVIRHALSEFEEMGQRTDVLVVHQATTPLTTEVDVLNALNHFFEGGGTEPVVSVAAAQHPPQWSFYLEKGHLQPLLPNWNAKRRQDLDQSYTLNGALYVATPDWLEREGSFLVPGRTRALIMPQEHSVDIDYEADLQLANLLAGEHPAIGPRQDAPMTQTIQIGAHFVGEGQPVYVIAEAGVNHNGDPDIARQLIVAAKAAGASCVKFQTFRAERVATAQAPKADYQLLSTDPAESQIGMLKRLELAEQCYAPLISACNELGIDFLSTPYSVEDVDFLEQVGVPAYKIASATLVEPHLLRRIAITGKPLILSTGLATLAEVSEAIRTVCAAGNDQIVLLQCTTNYPSAVSDANLRAMDTMRQAFGTLVGYSDHTVTPTACVAAVALGACVIEKHLTLDRSMPGPDHACSSEPDELTHLIEEIRAVESALGSPDKQPTEAERANSLGMRRSIVAARDISRGAIITADDLTTKRPATGISPRLWDNVLGRRAARDIAADSILTWEMCSEQPDS
jgi:N,N'-diacetyllegionaminate synthase